MAKKLKLCVLDVSGRFVGTLRIATIVEVDCVHLIYWTNPMIIDTTTVMMTTSTTIHIV